MYERLTRLMIRRRGGRYRRFSLWYRHSCTLSRVQTVSFGEAPTSGRPMPVTNLMPFFARRTERPTSRRMRSARSLGLSALAMDLLREFVKALGEVAQSALDGRHLLR